MGCSSSKAPPPVPMKPKESTVPAPQNDENGGSGEKSFFSRGGSSMPEASQRLEPAAVATQPTSHDSSSATDANSAQPASLQDELPPQDTETPAATAEAMPSRSPVKPPPVPKREEPRPNVEDQSPPSPIVPAEEDVIPATTESEEVVAETLPEEGDDEQARDGDSPSEKEQQGEETTSRKPPPVPKREERVAQGNGQDEDARAEEETTTTAAETQQAVVEEEETTIDEKTEEAVPAQREPKREAQPCDSYQLNLHGASFGECMCGHPKAAHSKGSLDAGANATNRFKALPRSFSGKTAAPADGHRAADRAGPCLNYTVDLTAPKPICKECGFAKADHTNRLVTGGAETGKNIFKEMSRGSFKRQSSGGGVGEAAAGGEGLPAPSVAAIKSVPARPQPAATTATTPTPREESDPLLRAFAVYELAHVGIRASLATMDQMVEAQDLTAFEKEWKDLSRLLETHAEMEVRGVVPLFNEVSLALKEVPLEESFTATPLRLAELRVALDEAIERGFAHGGVMTPPPPEEEEEGGEAAGNTQEGESTRPVSVPEAYASWSDLEKQWMSAMEGACERFALQVGQSPAERSEIVARRVLIRGTERGDFNFYITWNLSKLQNEGEDRLLTFVLSLRKCASKEQWSSKWMGLVRQKVGEEAWGELTRRAPAIASV